MIEPVKVFITVDVEMSIGGAFADKSLKPVGADKRVYCKIKDSNYGIPLIIDILGKFGLKATFFLEVLNMHYFGMHEMENACRYLLRNEQDVQLHIHPNYLNFLEPYPPTERRFSDLMANYSLEEQTKLISEAKGLLQSYSGNNITAFRAGCFGANLDTLTALKNNGFLIDSSYSRTHLQTSCFLDHSVVNDLIRIEDIYEFPITHFWEKSYIRKPRLMPLDINGVSGRECIAAMEQTPASGPSCVTIILHSFSFVKAYDVQYSHLRPRRNVITRFIQLCRFLGDNKSRFSVRTLGSLTKEDLTALQNHSSHHVPQVPWWLSILRGIAQVKDRF